MIHLSSLLLLNKNTQINILPLRRRGNECVHFFNTPARLIILRHMVKQVYCDAPRVIGWERDVQKWRQLLLTK